MHSDSVLRIWHESPDYINHSQVGNVFMLGAGGLVAVTLSAYFGRYPVLFWFIVFAVGTAAWCAAATSFPSFMAARILNGFFSTVAQGGGLMFIKDMYFFHEHARKINMWAAFIILSPYFGPMFTAFIINTQRWEWAFGLYTIMTGLCLIAIVIFADETYYDRRIPVAAQPTRGSHFSRMIGIAQWRSRQHRNTLGQALQRPIIAISKLPIFLTALYYMLTFAWVVGINTTLSIFLTPLYSFGPKQIGKHTFSSLPTSLLTVLGFFYFTPVVAALIGEATGHWLHDFVARFSMKRNHGILEPEARLKVIWVSMPFMVAGLILLGFSLENGYHYMVTSVGWGIYVFGIMITTVGVNAYNLDSYPEVRQPIPSVMCFHSAKIIRIRPPEKSQHGSTLHALLAALSSHTSRWAMQNFPANSGKTNTIIGHMGRCARYQKVSRHSGWYLRGGIPHRCVSAILWQEIAGLVRAAAFQDSLGCIVRCSCSRTAMYVCQN